MDDPQVYLEKLSAFTRMLRLSGINATHQETADACAILLKLGFEDRETVRLALGSIYAKTREEQLIFERVFDGYFISEEVMWEQAKQQAQREMEMDAARQEAREQLNLNGQPIDLSDEQRSAYASCLWRSDRSC